MHRVKEGGGRRKEFGPSYGDRLAKARKVGTPARICDDAVRTMTGKAEHQGVGWLDAAGPGKMDHKQIIASLLLAVLQEGDSGWPRKLSMCKRWH